MAKQLPIRRVGTSVPPVFEWYQNIITPDGVCRTVLQRGSVAVSMEKALCALIAEVERLEYENNRLTNIYRIHPFDLKDEGGRPITLDTLGNALKRLTERLEKLQTENMELRASVCLGEIVEPPPPQPTSAQPVTVAKKKGK